MHAYNPKQLFFDPWNLILTSLATLTIVSSLFFNGDYHLMYSITVSSAALILGLSTYLYSGATVRISSPGVFLALLLIWSALSISWSMVPYVSAIELACLASAFSVYLVVRSANADVLERAIEGILLAIGLALATSMTAQTFIGHTPQAMFRNPNAAAGYLNMIWPIAASAWLVGSVQIMGRIILGAFIAIFFFAIALTGSRAAIVAAFVALIILITISIIRFRKTKEVVGLGILVVSALLLANFNGDNQVSGAVQSMQDPSSAGASRFAIWTAALEMIQERPWLGYGPGVFYLAYPAFRLSADNSAGYFVHNDYLEFWLERGLPGLLIIGAIVICCIWTFYKGTRGGRSKPAPSIQPGLLSAFSGLATVAIHGAFSYNLQTLPFLILVGFKLAQLERQSQLRPVWTFPIPRVRNRVLPTVSLLGLMAIAIWQLASQTLYFRQVDEGIQHEVRGAYPKAVDSFARARALWSLPDSAWYLQANTHLAALRSASTIPRKRERQRVTRALELLDEAAERNRLQPAVPLIRGLLQANHPEFAAGSAEHSFRQALKIDPGTVGARYALSQVLENKGRRDAALEVALAGLTIRPRRGDQIAPLVERIETLRRGERNGSQRPEKGAPNIATPPTSANTMRSD